MAVAFGPIGIANLFNESSQLLRRHFPVVRAPFRQMVVNELGEATKPLPQNSPDRTRLGCFSAELSHQLPGLLFP